MDRSTAITNHVKSDRSKIIEELQQYFKGKQNVLMAFLFGSHARQKALMESDVDVAVFFNKQYTQADVNTVWGELEDLLKHDVDLVVLNTAPPTIAWAAIRGVPVCIRDYRLYLEYMLDVSREAEDFQDFLLDLWEYKRKLRRK